MLKEVALWVDASYDQVEIQTGLSPEPGLIP